MAIDVRHSVLLVGKPTDFQKYHDLLKLEFGELISYVEMKDTLAHLAKNEPSIIIVTPIITETQALNLTKDLNTAKYTSQLPLLFIYPIGEDWNPASFIGQGLVDFISDLTSLELLKFKIHFLLEIQHQKSNLAKNLAQVSSEAEFEKTFLLENALDAVIGLDEEKKVIFWNKNAEKIFGWSKEEVLGQEMTDMIVPPEFREAHRRGIQRFISTGVAKIQNQRIEIPGLRKNGEIFMTELTVSSIKTPLGYRFYSFMRDISKEKQTALQLRESEEELRSLANSIPQLAWMAKADGYIFWYNERWYEYTGTTPEQMEGWGWQSVHDPKVLPAVIERWKDSIDTGTPFEMTFPLRSSRGEFRSFLTRVAPVRDSQGVILRWFGTNTDIEDRVSAQLRAKVDEERLRFALVSAKMGSWSVNLATNECTFSDEYLRLFDINDNKYTVETIIKESIHPDDRALVDLEFRNAVEQNIPYRSEYRIRHKNGDIRWILGLGHAQYSPSGSPSILSGVVMDITDKKLKENELLESEMHLRAAIDSSAGGFYGIDKDGVTTVCNSAFLEMIGFKSQSEAIGKKLHDVIHHTHHDGRHYPIEECPLYKSALVGTSAHITNELFYRLDGSSFPVEYWTLPLIYNGEVRGAVTTIIDISERKENEAALLRAKEEAERANQLKSAFLANMSHEIRTPLGAMLGFADLLRDRNLTESQRTNYTNILSRNGEQLSVIINDILDISKVEAGHLRLEYRDVNPAQIAAEVLSLLQVKASEKDLALELSIEDSAPSLIVSDPTRIRQVLLNLVSNAIKFTQFGSVKIRGYGCLSANHRPSMCFEVIDTGIGIAKGQQEKIFEVFVQADGSMTRRFGGTGLGLALSRRLALALSGQVQLLESKERHGSVFLFQVEDKIEMRNLNYAEEKEELASEFVITENILLNKKILVVDDSPDNQELIWSYLTKYGATVDCANNGLSGYRKAIAGDFDIVLMDIQMPEMDGYSATQKLRDVGFRKPIIALTAHAMDEVRKKSLNVGCNDHLSKPINPLMLIQKIVLHTV